MRYTHPDLDGIFPGPAFKLGEGEDAVSYPAAWLETATIAEIAELGFVEFVEPEAAPTEADVIAERERRLALGFDYDFGDERGVHRIGTTPDDMAGWDEVTKLAAAYVAKGEGSALILISTDTGPVQVTALEWQDILVAAGDVRQPIYQASFALMAMEPIPADYADDSHWPTA